MCQGVNVLLCVSLCVLLCVLLPVCWFDSLVSLIHVFVSVFRVHDSFPSLYFLPLPSTHLPFPPLLFHAATMVHLLRLRLALILLAAATRAEDVVRATPAFLFQECCHGISPTQSSFAPMDEVTAVMADMDATVRTLDRCPFTATAHRCTAVQLPPS